MINYILRLFRRLRGLPPFTIDDVVNAEIDNAYHDHSQVVAKVNVATERQTEGNARLRASLAIAREQTTAFAEFEKSIRNERRYSNVR